MEAIRAKDSRSLARCSIAPRCLHCGRVALTTARGICRICWSIRKIRVRYPRLYRAPEKDFYGQGDPPSEPCPYLPGDPRKLLVLAERAAKHQQLHHPQDARRFLLRGTG